MFDTTSQWHNVDQQSARNLRHVTATFRTVGHSIKKSGSSWHFPMVQHRSAKFKKHLFHINATAHMISVYLARCRTLAPNIFPSAELFGVEISAGRVSSSPDANRSCFQLGLSKSDYVVAVKMSLPYICLRHIEVHS